jgi:hypothetical protein
LAAAHARLTILVRRERRVTFMTGSVIATAIICYFPITTMYMVRCTVPVTISPTAMNFGFWTAFLNSACNPIVYTICNPDFRGAFRKYISSGRIENMKTLVL